MFVRKLEKVQKKTRANTTALLFPTPKGKLTLSALPAIINDSL